MQHPAVADFGSTFLKCRELQKLYGATNGKERAATFEQCVEVLAMLPHKNMLYQIVQITVL